MISKNKIKYFRSLQIKKFREAHQKLLVYGKKIVQDLAANHPQHIIEIMGLDEFAPYFDRTNLPFTTTDEKTLKQISGLTSPPPLIAHCHFPSSTDKAAPQPLLLYLDDIQDPGNLGTILRTANWYGHHHILLSPRCADRYNPKVIQSSMGAVFDLFIEILEGYEMVAKYPQYRLIAAHLEGVPPTKIVPHPYDIVIIGNEGQGVHPEILKITHINLRLPGRPNPMTESLNAAISAGIICYNWDMK